VKFDFSKPTQMKKLETIKWFKTKHRNTLVKENIIQMTHCVCKMALKCQKIARKVTRNTIVAEPPTRMMHISHS